MKRRQFIIGAGAAAMWPVAARSQQPGMPVIGLVGSATARQWAPFVAEFIKGLSETGFVDGQNVVIEYRWAEGQFNRLPAMAADLIQRQVSVIAALTIPESFLLRVDKVIEVVWPLPLLMLWTAPPPAPNDPFSAISLLDFTAGSGCTVCVQGAE